MNQLKYIIRKRAMGDVLWTEPIVRAFAQKYKRIIVYTKSPLLFENFPFKNVVFKEQLSNIEKAIIFAEKRLGLRFFSLHLDEVYEKNPTVHFFHAFQHEAKLPLTTEYPKLYLSKKELDNRQVEGRYIILHIESFSEKKFRQVYGINWEAVVKFFVTKNLKVVQVGTGKGQIAGTILLKTSLRELISLVYHAEFFIGIDSGPSHIAASLGIPSLLVFGAIDPTLRHFPELFNGTILKQHCDQQCTNYDVDREEEHSCTSLQSGGIPRCCIYTTESIFVSIKQVFKDDHKDF